MTAVASKSVHGLQSNKVYSLLNFVEIKNGNKTEVTLVKLRNAVSSNTYTGDWSN